MKFGMFTSGYQRLPLEKCFTDAAQLGYDYIELWGGYPHAFAPDVIEDYREIRRLQEHYGIPVPVYTPEHNAYPYNYMLGTEKQWRNCMAYLEVSVRAAGLIGAGQMLISGLGDQHIDVIINKLKNRYGVSVQLEDPKIPYRETIRKKVSAEGLHKKQSGGAGQYGKVVIEFEPGE